MLADPRLKVLYDLPPGKAAYISNRLLQRTKAGYETGLFPRTRKPKSEVDAQNGP